MDAAAFRNDLTSWYLEARRDLPWRRTRDPYRVWISEIMLQQTRVAAAIPYYERFLEQFPDVAALAAAKEDALLAAWAGLGYYSRARNLQKAAAEIVAQGAFPSTYEDLLRLPGIGPYTAAAIASIVFDQPHAAVDGNVQRVAIRLTNNAQADVPTLAQKWLDASEPGQWNQAMMELGATVCIPRAPLCHQCPVARHCRARRAGTAAELPPKRLKPETVRKHRTLWVIEQRGRILLVPSPRVSGFWDLPEPYPGAVAGETLGAFRHAITNSQYRFEVVRASAHSLPTGGKWFRRANLITIALGTTAKKALRCLGS